MISKTTLWATPRSSAALSRIILWESSTTKTGQGNVHAPHSQDPHTQRHLQPCMDNQVVLQIRSVICRHGSAYPNTAAMQAKAAVKLWKSENLCIWSNQVGVLPLLLLIKDWYDWRQCCKRQPWHPSGLSFDLCLSQSSLFFLLIDFKGKSSMGGDKMLLNQTFFGTNICLLELLSSVG